jgi:hypothetical protein
MTASPGDAVASFDLHETLELDDLQQRAARGDALLLGQQKRSPPLRTADD